MIIGVGEISDFGNLTMSLFTLECVSFDWDFVWLGCVSLDLIFGWEFLESCCLDSFEFFKSLCGVEACDELYSGGHRYEELFY